MSSKLGRDLVFRGVTYTKPEKLHLKATRGRSGKSPSSSVGVAPRKKERPPANVTNDLSIELGNCPGAQQLPIFVWELLANPPSRGEGLHNWLFRVARLLHAFCTPDEIVTLLASATDGEPLQPNEIENAVESSRECAWQPKGFAGRQGCHRAGRLIRCHRPKWAKGDKNRVDGVACKGGGLRALKKRSTWRYEGSGRPSKRILIILFPGDRRKLLCLGASPQCCDTRTQQWWLQRKGLELMSCIVPSPMSALTGRTKNGEVSVRCEDNVGPRRFIVVEFDRENGPDGLDRQANLLMHLSDYAPLAMVVFSGGKSLHGWFFCQGQPEETVRKFFDYACALGADPAMWTKCQPARLPDGTRRNKDGTSARQPVVYFDPTVLKEEKP